MLAELIKRTDQDASSQWFAEIIRFIGAIFLPPSVFVFVLRFCGISLKRKYVVAIFTISSVSLIVFFTNPLHLLFYKQIFFDNEGLLRLEYSYYYWLVHFPFSYLLITSSAAVSFSAALKAPKYYKKQLIILSFSILVPLVSNAFSVFQISDFPLTALSFPFFFSLIVFVVLRYNFLQNNPLAYEKVFRSVRDMVVIVDKNNVIVDLNPTCVEILGKPTNEMIGSEFEKVFSQWHKVVEKYRHLYHFYDEVSVEIQGKRKFIAVTIVPIQNEDSSIEGRVFIFRDITNAKNYEFFLKNLAFQDVLTNIANRRKFEEDFERLLRRAESKKNPFSIVYFDLVSFKQINDNYGHIVGDELLKSVSTRVSSILRSYDLLARFGGDEFALLLHDCDEVGAQIIIERIHEAFSEPFKIKDYLIKINISVGIATYPKDGKNFSELLQKADQRLIEHKKLRKMNQSSSL